jgi:hypothetical protein
MTALINKNSNIISALVYSYGYVHKFFIVLNSYNQENACLELVLKYDYTYNDKI